jgi:hypothetical protein
MFLSREKALSVPFFFRPQWIIPGGALSLANVVMSEEDPLNLNLENRTFLLW